MKHPEPFLLHILDELVFLKKHTSGLSFGAFLKDEVLKRSVVRSLEVIGEAVKNLPLDFRKENPDVPWKEIAGLRDILIHDYFGIDYRAVWDIVKHQVPVLEKQVKGLLKGMKK